MVENENKECAPSEITDIWQYGLIFASRDILNTKSFTQHHSQQNNTVTCFHFLFRFEDDKKQWTGMIREMRYAAGASCVSMRLNAARMPKL